MIISKIVSRMPSPALSSNKASTSSSLFPIPTSSSLAEPSNTTRLAILAVSMPAREGSVNKTKDSIPSRWASARSFLMRDAAIFRAFNAFSTVFPSSPCLGLSPSVLRPAMGIAASSAENEGERREGVTTALDWSIEGGRKGDGLARLGRPMGDGLARLELPGGDKLGLARFGRPEEDRLGLARPGLGKLELPGGDELGLARFGLARPGLARPELPGGDRLGLTRFGRPEEDRFGLARPGLARPGRPSDARG
mmetsp:Transcript_35408/g.57746  ORF Transcript_35408/g.57746 Transcript_35408/m.57746 type:complete len:252 (-) Transcript_35408:1037-1792(-)